MKTNPTPLTKEQDFVLGKLNKAIPCDHEIKFSDIDGDVIKNLLAQAELRGREAERKWWTGNIRFYNGEGKHAKDLMLEGIVVQALQAEGKGER